MRPLSSVSLPPDPNYVGEQLWWWGLALFGVAAGGDALLWTLGGTFFNSVILAVVTVMVEERMAEQPERAAAWAEYRKRTPVWLPIPFLGFH